MYLARVTGLLCVLFAGASLPLFADEPGAETQFLIRDFLPVKPISRAERAAGVSAVIENRGGTPVTLEARLSVPEGVRLLRGDGDLEVAVAARDGQEASWEIEAAKPGAYTLGLAVLRDGEVVAEASLEMGFIEPMPVTNPPYIPEPKPVETDILIGAHHCPLWEPDTLDLWSQLDKHPERTPALGRYTQDNPEVADWETKWATEHGISFFIYCWYRDGEGQPVKMRFGSAIHKALYHSRFKDKLKFTIMWENQRRGIAGVADEDDLMNNLMPFWIEEYFKDPSYLKVDNKPLLFVYRPEFLIDDLGGVDKVVEAFGKMRQACKDAGFDGLYLLGEYRGLDSKHLELMKRLGLDYTFAYVWPIAHNPTPEQAVSKQLEYIRKTQELGIIPQVVTVSQAWSGWRDEGSIWKIPPNDFERLLRKAKEIVSTFPAEELGSKMLLLDNWNEWGEGHYIAPYREYGFGYLDAVRRVFAKNPPPHTDIIPEDIGLGPYDQAYQAEKVRVQEVRKRASQLVYKREPPENGLVGWWAFDEEPGSAVALDYAGNRLGGEVHGASRVPGIDGNALMCDGGCVLAPNSEKLSPGMQMTLTCWLKTDKANQEEAWFINRIFSGAVHTGYRVGLTHGKLSFGMPAQPWSHHFLARDPLPLGRWVHVAVTFDGKTMRIYMDGEEQNALPRVADVGANTFPLCIGNYAKDHRAHFTGLLDEVKLYSRALTAEEVQAQYGQLAGRAEK